MLKNRTHILYSMLIIAIAAAAGVASPPASAGVFAGLANRSFYSQQKLGAPQRPLTPADTSPPSVPSGLTVSSAPTSLTLAWQPSNDNVGVTAYGFYLDGVQVGLTPATSAVFGGLACGTTHQLQVRAYDAVGNRSIKATISGSTSQCPVATDTQAPTVPSGLQVSSTKNSLTLAWQPSTDNVGVTAYGFYLDGAQAGLTGATSATFGGLACGTTHQLQVRAHDAAGNRSIKATTSGSTTPCAAPVAADTKAPSVPSGLRVSATQATLTLTWQRSTDNVAVTAYAFYLDGAQAGLTGATSATFGGLACGTTHQLQVRAHDAAGNRSIKATTSGSTTPCAGGTGPRSDTRPPTVPAALKVSTTKTSLTLTWTRSTDNVGVKAYGLYLDGKQKGATAKTVATFGGLACNTSHRLQVDAVDAAGNRSAKASIAARTGACGPTPGPAPGGGAATTFVSPRGSDKNLCTQTAPCASFQRGHRMTRCGGTVRIAPGSYVMQDIPPDPSKASCAQRVILDASGGAALTHGVKVRAAHVELVGVKADLSGCVTTKITPPCPSLSIVGAVGDVVARGVQFSRFYVFAPNVQILGSNFGPSYDNHGIVGAPTRNLLVSDTVIHDQWNSQACKAQPGCFGSNHMGCGTINDAANVTYQRNRIYNCEDVAALVKPYLGSNTNIRFENNVFGSFGGGRAIALTVTNYSASHQNSGIQLINNTFSKGQAFTVTPGVPYPNSSAIGNLGYIGSCGAIQQAGFAVNYNVSLGSGCGPHSRGVSTLGLAADGIHLLANSPAIGAASPTNHPANDIDGQARPPAGPVDAGADQH